MCSVGGMKGKARREGWARRGEAVVLAVGVNCYKVRSNKSDLGN